MESPQDCPPPTDFAARMRLTEADLMGESIDSIVNVDEPIDVNLPRDVSNIFYDYEEPTGENRETSRGTSSFPTVPGNHDNSAPNSTS